MSEDIENIIEAGGNMEGATRVRESAKSKKTAKKALGSCDSVSVEKMKRADGAEVTTVVHPARYLKRAGELRAALLTNDATVEGMPIKRQEIVSRKLTTQDDLMEKAKQSPALLRTLLESLTKLDQEIRDEHSNNGGAKK